MKLFSIRYKYTRYHRIQTHGGMDSEPAGSSTDESVYNVLAPCKELALTYLRSHGGNRNDPKFEVIAVLEDEVHAIVQVDTGFGPTLR